MPAFRLIVCERTGRWAALFRRALARQRMPIAETRSLAECGRQLAASSASVAAVEVSAANLENVIKLLPAWAREFPAARFVTVADGELAALEPLLREAGALDVLYLGSDVPRAAQLAIRRRALAPAEQLPWRQAIASRLPWAAWASAG
jgi:hypothetical protein